MNRAERRKLEKLNRKDKHDIIDVLAKKQEQVLNDGRAEAMFLLFILLLHRHFGFGQKRCLRIMQGVDDMMGLWLKGELDLYKLRQMVRDEVGIEITQ